MEEEQELIQKAKAHEAAAFSMLMQRHGSSLYKVAKAILKSDEDVADAMQETALSCWEKIDTLQSEQYFKTWLIRILINHCNTIRRKKSRYVLGTLLPGLLHISESAVKERLARARKTVAKQLHIPADAPQQGDFHSRIPRSSEGI